MITGSVSSGKASESGSRISRISSELLFSVRSIISSSSCSTVVGFLTGFTLSEFFSVLDFSFSVEDNTEEFSSVDTLSCCTVSTASLVLSAGCNVT